MKKMILDRLRFAGIYFSDWFTEFMDEMLYHAWFRRLLVGFEITCVLSPIVVYVLYC